ncbi:hypothetical protein DFH09DRAFT_1476417 [Mycena vulgaris]|nr:hypothetical protein DFH09DRAFT_1476417 [Mycena vulgaris]
MNANAGRVRIQLRLRKGRESGAGRGRIRMTEDGCGKNQDQISLKVTRARLEGWPGTHGGSDNETRDAIRSGNQAEKCEGFKEGRRQLGCAISTRTRARRYIRPRPSRTAPSRAHAKLKATDRQTRFGHGYQGQDKRNRKRLIKRCDEKAGLMNHEAKIRHGRAGSW